ncbi:ankyrin, partial [Peniophora sp. CONT]
GSTALHEAARRGRTEICRLLLNHGALIDDTNNNGHTPLLLATYSANLDTIHLLLEYPAPDGSNAATLRCRARNAQGQTALHQAAYYGHARVCCLLLEHGASVDELDNNSKNPLHYAARFGDLNTVRLL